MSDHYDHLETRNPTLRESEELAVLHGVVAHAMTAPGWARHLAGVDPKSVTSRAALAEAAGAAQIRHRGVAEGKSAVRRALNVTPPGKARRLLMSPGPIFEPEGHGGDWWGAARACFAAGFRAGDIVHNSLRLSPDARRLHSGSRARTRSAARSFPGGVGNTEQQLEAIAHYKPSGYIGTPDFLKILLDTAQKSGKDASSIKRGLVSGAALPGSLREELERAASRCCSATPPPSSASLPTSREAREGMIVNESVILEIVRPGTGDPVAGRRGRRGRRHVVQSGLSDDPARHRRPVRDPARASRPAAAPIPASRAGWAAPTRPPRSRACSCTRKQIAEVAARHPELTRVAPGGRPRGRAGHHDACRPNAPTQGRGAGRRRRRHPAVRHQA